jgi:hypothetical protein
LHESCGPDTGPPTPALSEAPLVLLAAWLRLAGAVLEADEPLPPPASCLAQAAHEQGSR